MIKAATILAGGMPSAVRQWAGPDSSAQAAVAAEDFLSGCYAVDPAAVLSKKARCAHTPTSPSWTLTVACAWSGADSLHVLTVYVAGIRSRAQQLLSLVSTAVEVAAEEEGGEPTTTPAPMTDAPLPVRSADPPSLFANPRTLDEDSAEAVALCRAQTTLLFAWCVAALDAQKARRDLAPLEEGEDGEDDEEPEEPEEDDTPWIYVSCRS